MLKTDLNPSINFKSQMKTVPSDTTLQYDNIDLNTVSDSVDISPANKQKSTKNHAEKKTFKEKISDVWKFLSSANKMVAASAKGLVYGAVTGVIFMSGSWLFKSLPKAFKKDGPALWQIIRHPVQNIGKSGKIIAGTAAGFVFALNIIKGKLDANQNTAVIDHKLKTGHRDK